MYFRDENICSSLEFEKGRLKATSHNNIITHYATQQHWGTQKDCT